MAEALVIVAYAVFAAGVWVLVVRARQARVGAVILRWAAVACLVLLIAMVATDWPTEWLAEFWAEHSVLAGLGSTLLLVGAGFLGIEARDAHEQEKLDGIIGSSALGGLVDHLIDIDLALALAAHPADLPEGWDQPGKPLRWLRGQRDDLQSRPSWSAPSADAFSAGDPGVASTLIDQAIRRLVSGMRDWAALASASSQGRTVLARLGTLRNGLMDLDRLVAARVDADTRHEAEVRVHWCRLRGEVELLAVAFERASGAEAPRRTLGRFPSLSLDDMRRAEVQGIVHGFGPNTAFSLSELLGRVPSPVAIGPTRRIAP